MPASPISQRRIAAASAIENAAPRRARIELGERTESSKLHTVVARMERDHRGESRPGADFAGDRQAPAMASDDVLDDGKPEASAAARAALAGVDAIKALGQPRQMFRRYAWSVVAHAEQTLTVKPRDADLDTPSAVPLVIGRQRAVFNGVLDKIFGDADQLVAIARDDDRPARAHGKIDAHFFGERS